MLGLDDRPVAGGNTRGAKHGENYPGHLAPSSPDWISADVDEDLPEGLPPGGATGSAVLAPSCAWSNVVVSPVKVGALHGAAQQRPRTPAPTSPFVGRRGLEPRTRSLKGSC